MEDHLFMVTFLYVRQPRKSTRIRAQTFEEAASKAKYLAATTPEINLPVRPVGMAIQSKTGSIIYYRVKKGFVIEVELDGSTTLARFNTDVVRRNPR